MKKVVFSIISTNLRYTNILLRYVDILLSRRLIHIVHIWCYGITEQFSRDLSNVCHRNPKYVLFEPPLPDEKRGHYYQHYSKYLKENEVLIKCDDRVVYLDVNTFGTFIDNITEDVVYFPNMVNNDVCAYFQQEEGSHDLFNYPVNKEKLKEFAAKTGQAYALSDWHKEPDKAIAIHCMFLKNKSRFLPHMEENKIIEYGNHMHLNMFGITAKYAKEMFPGINPQVAFNDNQYFAIAPLHNGKKNKICLGFLAVYFAFDGQDVIQLEEQYLSKYEEMALAQSL